MAEKLDPPRGFRELMRRYATGESTKSLAAEIGVSRAVFTRWLNEKGAETRDRSEAMFAMQRRLTSPERHARVAAAHAAVRGTSPTRITRLKQARSRCRLVGLGERELLKAFRAKGWPVEFQVPVDVYNVDLVVWGRIAVEPTCSSIVRPHTARKIPHLVKAGLVPVAITNAGRIKGCLDDLVTFVEILRGTPTIDSQYWVIGCTTKGPRLRLHHY